MAKRSASRSATPRSTTGKKRVRRLYVLSDSTGNLPQHMLTAFLTQFPPDAFAVRPINFLREEKLEAVMGEVAEAPGVVFHAVVSAQLKRLIQQRCKSLGAPCCDLTGKFVDFLSEASGLEPLADPRRLHSVDASYHRRIKALEFALEHDDGLGLETLHEADLVLTGVSRTSKTPTSIYLAQQGYRVGNVSLALGVAPPRQLLALPHRKVIGLTIDSRQLAEIRSNRQSGWRMTTTSYNDPEQVDREIAWSRRLFNERGWPVLNVTNQAVEETAGKILHTLSLPRPTAQDA